MIGGMWVRNGGCEGMGGLVGGSDTLVLPRSNGGVTGNDRWDEGAECGAQGNGTGWFGVIIRRNCRGITEERQGVSVGGGGRYRCIVAKREKSGEEEI